MMKILIRSLYIPILMLGICAFLSCKSNKLAFGNLNDKKNLQVEMDSLIAILVEDMQDHKDVEAKQSFETINQYEQNTGKQLPASYKHFVNKFGNGCYWLYHVDQPINGIDQIHAIGKFRKHLGNELETDGFGTFKKRDLLCLMSDSSNGGAWCWLTTEKGEYGEWPLAFYNIDDDKLYYKISGFVEWLRIATETKGEVIRALDKEDRLNLG